MLASSLAKLAPTAVSESSCPTCRIEEQCDSCTIREYGLADPPCWWLQQPASRALHQLIGAKQSVLNADDATVARVACSVCDIIYGAEKKGTEGSTHEVEIQGMCRGGSQAEHEAGRAFNRISNRGSSGKSVEVQVFDIYDERTYSGKDVYTRRRETRPGGVSFTAKDVHTRVSMMVQGGQQIQLQHATEEQAVQQYAHKGSWTKKERNASVRFTVTLGGVDVVVEYAIRRQAESRKRASMRREVECTLPRAFFQRGRESISQAAWELATLMTYLFFLSC